MDCGPTCLRMVAKHYKRNISLQASREKAQIGKEGVNLLGISEAAEDIGFLTQSVKLDFDTLVKDAKLPAILHWNQNHFVALYKKENAELIQAALDDWYTAEKKDYNVFAEKYLLNGELQMQGEKLEAMSKWCKETGITFTPTFFINEHQLPEVYKIEDVQNLL